MVGFWLLAMHPTVYNCLEITLLRVLRLTYQYQLGGPAERQLVHQVTLQANQCSRFCIRVLWALHGGGVSRH